MFLLSERIARHNKFSSKQQQLCPWEVNADAHHKVHCLSCVFTNKPAKKDLISKKREL